MKTHFYETVHCSFFGLLITFLFHGCMLVKIELYTKEGGMRLVQWHWNMGILRQGWCFTQGNLFSLQRNRKTVSVKYNCIYSKVIKQGITKNKSPRVLGVLEKSSEKRAFNISAETNYE